MTDPANAIDDQAGELVKASVAGGELAAFVRFQEGRLRIVAPDVWPDQLARLFYRAADEMAARALEKR